VVYILDLLFREEIIATKPTWWYLQWCWLVAPLTSCTTIIQLCQLWWPQRQRRLLKI